MGLIGLWLKVYFRVLIYGYIFMMFFGITLR